MTDNEAMAWEAFANVVMNFLWNDKSENYVEMVQKLVDTFTWASNFFTYTVIYIGFRRTWVAWPMNKG